MNDKKIKSMLKKKENKKRLRELWYKTMKPLANVLIKIDDKMYTYKENKIKKKVDSLTLEEVAEKASNLIVTELVNYYCGDGIYITIADKCYEDYGRTILDYIALRTEWGDKKDKVFYRWVYKNDKFTGNLELNKELTNMVENNLKSNSMIEIKHAFIERLKYSYASNNYKETVVFSLKEVE